MTPGEKLARAIHGAFCRQRYRLAGLHPAGWDGLNVDQHEMYIAVADDLLREQPDLLLNLLREYWPSSPIPGEGTQ